MLHSQVQPVKALLAECLALSKAMRQSIVVSGQTIAAAESEVLQLIEEHGPMSVPQIGRLRHTSRQNVQVVVNRLLNESWIELVDNPAHKRSALVCLTELGKTFPAKARAAEAEILGALAADFPVEALNTSTSLLTEMRKKLQAPRIATNSRTRIRKPAPRVELPEEEIPVSLL